VQLRTGVLGTGEATAAEADVGISKYRPYSCTMMSAATLDAPKIE